MTGQSHHKNLHEQFLADYNQYGWVLLQQSAQFLTVRSPSPLPNMVDRKDRTGTNELKSIFFPAALRSGAGPMFCFSHRHSPTVVTFVGLG